MIFLVYADEYDPERLLLLSRHYMEQIFKMQPIEGCTFFRCSLIQHAELNIPKEINLAVFLEGLHMFSVPQKILIRTFSIEEIIRWGFKPNGDFYFEVPNDNNEDCKFFIFFLFSISIFNFNFNFYFQFLIFFFFQ